MKTRCWVILSVVALGWPLFSTRAIGQTKEYLDNAVAGTLKRFNQLDPWHQDLANKAAGILIFPTVTKGGVALADEYGQGVLQVNGVTRGYYSIAAASVGITAGMASHSEVIIFVTRTALDAFLRSKGWSLGAEAGVALTSMGVDKDLNSEMRKKPVLIYVFNETGLMADMSLQESKISKIRK